MQYPITMQVEQPFKKLIHDRTQSWSGDRSSRMLCVPVDDLQEVVFCVFEHHEDALRFQNDFDKRYNVLVG